MGKRVLIEYDLLIDLIRYHLGELRGDDLEKRIYRGLEAKLTALANHQAYTQKLADSSTADGDVYGHGQSKH